MQKLPLKVKKELTQLAEEKGRMEGVYSQSLCALCVVILIALWAVTPMCIYKGIWEPKGSNVVPLGLSAKHVPLLVSRDATIHANGRVVPMAELERYLRARLSDQPGAIVAVAADESIAFGELSKIIGVVRSAGGRSVFLVAQGDPVAMYFRSWGGNSS